MFDQLYLAEIVAGVGALVAAGVALAVATRLLLPAGMRPGPVAALLLYAALVYGLGTWWLGLTTTTLVIAYLALLAAQHYVLRGAM